MSSVAYNLQIFSNVVATLSDYILEQIRGDKTELLQTIVSTENVLLLFDPASQVFSVSGLLQDVTACHEKLSSHLSVLADVSYNSNGSESRVNSNEKESESEIGRNESESDNSRNEMESENSRIKRETEDITLNVVIKQDEFQLGKETTDDVKAKVEDGVVESDEVNDRDEAETEAKDCGSEHAVNRDSSKIDNPSNHSRVVKHWKKRRKVLSAETRSDLIDDNTSDSFTVSKTKRGRVIKRPSKLAGSVFLSERLEEGLDNLDSYMLSRKTKSSKRISVYKEQKTKTAIGTKESENSELYTMEKLVGKTNIDNKEDVDDGDDGTPRVKDKKKQIRKHYEDKMPYRFFCMKCSFKSKRESHFNNHMQFHEKNPDLKLIKCDRCDFTCVRKSLLKKHQLCHEMEVLHCNRCRYKTGTKATLVQHMAKVHGPQRTYKFNCSFCGFSSFNKTRMANHVGIHHSKDKVKVTQTFSCDECSYSTMKRVHFERHKRNVHSNSRPFLCDLCGAAFKRTDTLAAHKITHIDRSKRKLPFRCGQCGKSFKSKAHLISHMSVHSSVRAFQCHICGQMFKTRQVQQKHQENIHYNPRSFKCTVCNKEFNTKYTLQRHVRTHDSDLLQQAEARAAQEDQQASEVFDDEGQGEDKVSLEQGEGAMDENMSAIQHITLSEFTQHLQNTSDQMQQGTDMSTIYIEGLETVVPESGTINIVNMNGQDIQQIVLPPRTESADTPVNINQFISQITAAATPSGVNQDTSKGVNSEVTDRELSEIYVSTVNITGEDGLTDSGEIDQVYIQTDHDIHDIKHILVSSKYDPSMEESGTVIQTGEIIIDQSGSLVKHDIIQQ